MGQSLRQAVVDMFYIWRKEMQIIFHDEGVIIFCLLVPLLYPVLYTLIYNTEVMHDVPVTVVDQSNSSLSREFIRKADASPWLKITGMCINVEQAKKLISEEQTYGYLLIPNDFAENIEKGKQSYVGAYSDMGGMLYYKGILIGATDASLEMNRDIKIRQSEAVTSREEAIATYPIENEEIAQFNPTIGFASFLIPAVLMMIIQQTLLLGIGMAGGTMIERRRYDDLLLISSHHFGSLHVIWGRSLAYFMLYCVTTAYMVCLIPYMFDLVRISLPTTMVLFLLPYLLACIFFAITMSVVLRNREISILVFVVTSVPLLFLSGVSWPSVAIPPFLKGVSWLFPSTFGVNGFVRINTMGATLEQVSFEYCALWIQAVVYFCLSYLVTLLQARRERSKTEITNAT